MENRIAGQVLTQVQIAAPLEAVWRALRDPAIIRTWFGWDADTLADEIEFIFIAHADADDQDHVIRFGEWEGVADAFVLEARDGGTLVQVLRNGAPATDWDSSYDEVREGWVSFVAQLKLALERHVPRDRRTIYLAGEGQAMAGEPLDELGLRMAAEQPLGSAYRVRLPTGDEISGQVWHRSGFQTGLTVSEWGEGLIVVTAVPTSDKRPHGGAMAILTTYGFTEEALQTLDGRWRDWWTSVYPPKA